MKFSSTLLALASTATFVHGFCDNEDYDHDILNISKAEMHGDRARARRAFAPIEVDLYYHLIVKENPMPPQFTWDGLWKQIDYMKAAYKPYGITFNTKPVDIIVNAAWADDINYKVPADFKKVHKGGYNAVNIYAGQGYTSGVCSFPAGMEADKLVPLTQDDVTFDGCHVTLGAATNPISGTPSHEVGHWFGLFHPFQGGCTEPNDYCDDTPQQAKASYSHETVTGNKNTCPAVNTCPNNPGNDNVFNFMDYTDCSHEFTAQQGWRMNTVFDKYRRNRQVAA
ncbi:hypothetical protein BU16DRAFT_540094 [Lophium mytilinum]|uniref:Peptidase M43 pregnancy-associated plasma-A domain-containing protein n=1 Tax=Lophium mytilinum TaxID=390894 RepID=A0A6A6QR23_9PEZI|nr:hypothetical protein BU16DRAFT_540094 [Lophium mytilinum]